MDNQILLENLAKLQKSLEDIESSRTMVDETVGAYKGGANQIKAYSEQLATVSDKISQLIEQIKQNKDVLSFETNQKINSAITNIEQAASIFSNKTQQQIDSLKENATLKTNELNTAVNNFVGVAKKTIQQSAEDSEILQKKAISALEAATAKMDTTVTNLIDMNNKQYMDFKISIGKKMLFYAIIFVLLMIANIIMHFVFCN